jgi:hypothetical protein
LPWTDDLVGLAKGVRQRFKLELLKLRTLTHHLARPAHTCETLMHDAQGSTDSVHRRYLPSVAGIVDVIIDDRYKSLDVVERWLAVVGSATGEDAAQVVRLQWRRFQLALVYCSIPLLIDTD